MNIKKLEQATKILEKIKLIDREIIEIDKLAIMILNNETKISLELNVENLIKSEENKDLVSFEEDSSHIDMSRYYKLEIPSSMKRLLGSYQSEPKKQGNTFTQTLSDKLTLQILGTILCEKNNIKDNLIKKLVGFGFSI